MNTHSFELRSSNESTYMQNTYALFSLPKSYVFDRIMWIIKHDIEDNRVQFIVPTQERQAVACPGQKNNSFRLKFICETENAR